MLAEAEGSSTPKKKQLPALTKAPSLKEIPSNRSLTPSKDVSRSSSLAARDGGQIDEQAIRSLTLACDLESVFTLRMQHKLLDTMAGALSKLVNLTHLDLSHNQLQRIEGLEELSQLRVLQLGSNQIARVENVGHLSALQQLSLQGNAIASLQDAGLDLLARLQRLSALHFQALDRSAANPVCSAPGYKQALLSQLPALANLDGERLPASSIYMRWSHEVDNPPAARPVQLPEVKRWWKEEQTQVSIAASEERRAMQAQHAQTAARLDECAPMFAQLQDSLSDTRAELDDLRRRALAAAAAQQPPAAPLAC